MGSLVVKVYLLVQLSSGVTTRARSGGTTTTAAGFI